MVNVSLESARSYLNVKHPIAKVEPSRYDDLSTTLEYYFSAMALSEQKIRQLLRLRAARYAEQYQRFIVLIEELELDKGATRIDMVFLGDNSVGIEIKSSKDNLNRLPNQSESYSRYFDYMILVSDDRFAQEAKGIVPDWWGITSICTDYDRICFRQIQKAKLNPKLEITALVQLLWKSELLHLIEMLTPINPNPRKSKKELREILLKSVEDLHAVKKHTIEALYNRSDWRSELVRKQADFIGEAILQ